MTAKLSCHRRFETRCNMFSRKTQILIVRIIAVVLVIAMVGTLLAALL